MKAKAVVQLFGGTSTGSPSDQSRQVGEEFRLSVFSDPNSIFKIEGELSIKYTNSDLFGFISPNDKFEITIKRVQ